MLWDYIRFGIIFSLNINQFIYEKYSTMIESSSFKQRWVGTVRGVGNRNCRLCSKYSAKVFM